MLMIDIDIDPFRQRWAQFELRINAVTIFILLIILCLPSLYFRHDFSYSKLEIKFVSIDRIK